MRQCAAPSQRNMEGRVAFISRQLSHGKYGNETGNYLLTLVKNVSHTLMICTTHPYVLLWGNSVPAIQESSGMYAVNISPPYWYSDCLTHYNVTSLNVTYVMVLKRRAHIWLPVGLNRTWSEEHALHILLESMRKLCPKWFLATLIAFIVSAVIIIASAATATTALVNSVQTAHKVESVLVNVTQELQTQVDIDKGLMSGLQALEAAVEWLGEHQNALYMRMKLKCDWQVTMQCVTPLLYNSSLTSWQEIKKHLQGAFNTSLANDITGLQARLERQLQEVHKVFSQKIL
uniref:Retroviral envelope protein GP41-like domain-containing protein n=1 Tax=Equus caballus TaxID=9796 RepID=A0A9L0RC25_HORSE